MWGGLGDSSRLVVLGADQVGVEVLGEVGHERGGRQQLRLQLRVRVRVRVTVTVRVRG